MAANTRKMIGPLIDRQFDAFEVLHREGAQSTGEIGRRIFTRRAHTGKDTPKKQQDRGRKHLKVWLADGLVEECSGWTPGTNYLGGEQQWRLTDKGARELQKAYAHLDSLIEGAVLCEKGHIRGEGAKKCAECCRERRRRVQRDYRRWQKEQLRARQA